LDPEKEQSNTADRPVRIRSGARGLAGVIGLVSLGAGGAAVFVRDVEAGPVALIAVGFFFLIIAVSGVLPTRLKFGENEAEWREETKIAERIKRSTDDVGKLLDASGVSLENAVEGKTPEIGPDLARAGIGAGSIAEDVRLLQARGSGSRVPSKALLELARWYLAQKDWGGGIKYLEEYLAQEDDDWQAWFSLGAAHANRRDGPASDRAALRSYDMAAAHWPEGVSNPLTARLYSHRAAIKKRLGRLPEAKADAEVALQFAKSEYDVRDAIYNLACVEAMLGEPDEAIRYLKWLHDLGGIYMIRGHVDDYFASLKDRDDFRSLTGLPTIKA
jgi:tetratricopeptide (TPR) repeat protein